MNLKAFAAVCVFMQVHLLLSAQIVDGVKSVSSVEFFIPPIGVAYAYEMNVAPAMTMRYSGMLFYSFGMYDNIYNEKERWGMLGYGLSTESRWYYNYKKRQSKGKNVRCNSSGYFALQLRYAYTPYQYSVGIFQYDHIGQNTLSVMPRWGMRRNLGQRFYFDGSFGLGYIYGEYSGNGLATMLTLSLGYVFW